MTQRQTDDQLPDERLEKRLEQSAGATFTLLAWGFAYAYIVCQAWVPDSFIGGGILGSS